MNISLILSVIGKVLTNKFVIIALIAVIIYLNFFSYVMYYRKKPKVAKKKKISVQAQTPAPEESESDDGNFDDE